MFYPFFEFFAKFQLNNANSSLRTRPQPIYQQKSLKD